MRKLKFVIAAALLLSVSTMTLMAQDKFGYLNSSEIVKIMPEMEEVTKKFQAYQTELGDTYNTLLSEYNTKMAEYTKKATEWSESMQGQKSKELKTLTESLKSFESDADQQLQQKQTELMDPIVAKVRSAIEAVGKDNGFSYIMEESNGNLLYINKAKAIDVMPLVKAKLGLK